MAIAAKVHRLILGTAIPAASNGNADFISNHGATYQKTLAPYINNAGSCVKHKRTKVIVRSAWYEEEKEIIEAMSKKNKGRNGFYFFMRDWQKRQEEAGFTVDLKAAATDPKCSEEWKNLSPQEKGFYKAMAQESKVRLQGSMRKKTVLGEDVSEVEEQIRREQEFEQNMFEYIKSVISMGTKHNTLKKLKFIFIHVNWFYQREIGINKYEFCPAEFAVAEFSLENGIENVYHEVLKMKIPLGWRRDAVETSQQTHQIPIELEDGQSDFLLMYNRLTELLEANMTGNKYPPLFTAKDLKPAVESLLIRLAAAANASVDDFLIYSLEPLFAELRNAAVQNVSNDHSIPLVVAEHEFAKDMFSSTRNIECEFHRNIDGTSQYCSKAIVRRWGFTICDYCCEYLDIKMIEGVHQPPKSDMFISQDYIPNSDVDIDIDLKCVSISEQQIVDMNGVSLDHRRKVSERNHQDEQRRRNECRPLDIIDHSKFGYQASNSSVIMPTRPLRPPKTKPQALFGTEETQNPLDAENFPPIGGRGIMQKKKVADRKIVLGRGHGYH